MSPDSSRITRWLTALRQTAASDRAAAEAAVGRIYSAAGLVAPRCCWFDSPFRASHAVALLVERFNPARAVLLASERRSPKTRAPLEQAERALQAALGVSSLRDVLSQAGAPLNVQLAMGPDGMALHQARLSARILIHGGVGSLFATPRGDDLLAAAESAFWGANDRGVITSGLFAGIMGTLIGSSDFTQYTWSQMVADEEAATGAVPDVLRGSWDVAMATGPWWPFQGMAILSERPSELHLNASGLPDRSDGPAIIYRDGWSVYAKAGKAIDPRKVQPAVASSARRTPASALLTERLPADPDARLERLRSAAGGALPLFDRYIAGDHIAVWRELEARGEAVRADPHAADAMAVAGETMRRVAADADSLIERLRAIGYHFTGNKHGFASPHVAPSGRADATLKAIERRAGPLPLSLRAFYEIVGAVCLVGRHPSIAPDAGDIASDPLWIYGAADVLEALEGEEDADEILLAPDDLHKADVSGGDSYAIGMPAPFADGRVQHARFDVSFVEYLRLAFRCGGFPGYADIDRDVPPELTMLASDLLPF
jgi:hypothetical protein